MNKKIGVLLVTVFSMGATSDATQLATSSLKDVRSSLEKHEQRTEALQQLSQAMTADDETHEESVVVDAEVPKMPRPVVRLDEDSFAKRLDGGGVADSNHRSARLSRVIDAIANGVDSIAALESLVKEYPAYRDARLALARMQLLRGAPAKSVVALKPLTTQLMEADHPDWQAWFWRGSARLAMHELDAARKDLETALAKDKRQVVIWIQLAVVEQELENHTAALEYLDIAQQLDPTIGQIYVNRAYSLEHLGEFKQAQAAYRAFMVADAQYASRQIRGDVARRISDLAQYQAGLPGSR